ncbi:MAG: transporter substrate-binding domain-containing protein [Bacteroidales bacterium]|nr:transporter substrate-binding domain-containing protein [Bacteroidales bacterium]
MKYHLPPRKTLRLIRHIFMVALLVLAVYFTVVAVRFQQHKANDTDKKIDVITVGLVGKTNSDGDTTCNLFALEAIKQFAIDNHADINIVLYPTWENCLDAFEKMECNIVGTPVPTTLEMKHHYKLSEHLYETTLQLLQSKDVPLPSSVLELDSATLWIEKKSPYKAQLNYLVEEAGITLQIKELGKNVDLDSVAQLVTTHQIEYFAVDECTAMHLCTRWSNLRCSIALSVQQPMAWMIEEHRETLYNLINYWVERYKEKDAYQMNLTNHLTYQ